MPYVLFEHRDKMSWTFPMDDGVWRHAYPLVSSLLHTRERLVSPVA
jgi:hypothetical protein